MKIKSTKAVYINLYKILAVPVILGLMFYYQNFSTEAYVYLSLHGTYCFLWFLKYLWFRDETFKGRISFIKGFSSIFLVSLGYFAAPFILISQKIDSSALYIALVLFFYIIGIFFHYVSDIQKYYTLKYRKGLIKEGMFSRTRNPNYFGEIMMYASLAMLSKHWIPFFILGSLVGFVFLGVMTQKDKFLSQFPEFDDYKKKTWLLFPKFF
ncbi:DUF1295 domain-containing protein [Fulvivirga sp. M361]|uniref:DUF1295 domain-containing protein n=1 Tax=Fulvivirga sp. M361 TaxID=2594266 RepID=UPI00117AA089|nr:DUF1295 domain-containing protein [Fulvivirga sp. M361]TRX58664.1 DUF1295 domain-containing protein [Fulvivirga sp. M361]